MTQSRVVYRLLTYGPTTLGEVERSRLKFGIKRSIPFFRKESQIVLPLDLRLDLSLRCFEMTYKNILQKFCVNFLSI